MPLRLCAGAVTLLLCAQIVRNAAVHSFAALHPELAAKVWQSHPDVESSIAMMQIAVDSRARQPISQSTFAMLDDVARKLPLAPEPFLVDGVRAQLAGKLDHASRAFEEAQWRNPRSVGAAYFLAEFDFQTGHVLAGLKQTAILGRLTPGGGDSIAPFIAAYAKNPANWPVIRTFFRSGEAPEDQVLALLAQDPRNLHAIIALADDQHRKPGSVWFTTLLQSLIANADYGAARSLWSSFGRPQGQKGELIYDPSFSSPEAPPPFNWALTSSEVGVAERQPGKGLHALFFGNQDGVLATQLLQLDSGSYRFQVNLVGPSSHKEQLQWSLRCDRLSDPIATISLDQAAHGWVFEIPATCPAQWLELAGKSTDVSQQSDVTINSVNLSRAAEHE